MSTIFSRNCDHCGEKYTGRGSEYCSRMCSFKSEKRKLVMRAYSKMKSGKMHSCWKGGETNRSGYTYSWTTNGYKAAHRIALEKLVGRDLFEREVVHHNDEDKKNNDLSNLTLFRHKSAHNRLHKFALRHGLRTAELSFSQNWLTN